MTPREYADQRKSGLSPWFQDALLIGGTSVLAALALSDSPLFAEIWRIREGERGIPFLDQAPAPPDAAMRQYGEFVQPIQ
jgi:hypothetical protein